MEFYNKIHCRYTGIKGFVTLYNDALRYQYMITDAAKQRAEILAFWRKHGLQAAIDAFKVGRRTLYAWKGALKQGGGKLEALNPGNRTPKTKRKRLWPEKVISELKRLRWAHPNLGKEKCYPLLKAFCKEQGLHCPESRTIGRLIHDLGGLRVYPQKIRHDGRVVALKHRTVLRKPKDFKAEYPGHLVALDTVERFVHGLRRYVITFEDIHTRFCFAWATKSHASLAAKEFFGYCRRAFPFPMVYVLTDNGSEFMKHFDEELRRLHLTHYHTYPKTPKMNAHCERFNRTIQEEFIDYHNGDLLDPVHFNRLLIDWLIWYNTERVHYAFDNKLSPVQFMLTLPPRQPLSVSRTAQECKVGWPHTRY